MLRSILCDCSDEYILFKGTIINLNSETVWATEKNAYKKVTFKNCAPFTSCISKINSTQIDDAQCIDVVMPIYNLIEQNSHNI